MQSRGDVSINNFVKGLITEASPLTFPQGASLDEVNFALLRDGSRERRLGLDLEENYGLHDSGLSADVLNGARVQAYRWIVPNGNIEQDIGVIQLGNRIYFIDLYTQNPSATFLNGGAPITTSEITNDVLMTFTTINNYLVGIANQLPQPYLFTYNPDTDIVSVETAPIQVRDLWGVDDGLGVTNRPITLSATHKYNLLNQGWLDSIVSTCGGGITAIDCTFNTFGVYPSNSDQWSVGRIEDLTSADVKKFDPEIASRNLVSTGQVARGHFIIDLYNRGASRSAQTGLTLPVDREISRINAIAAYAGRIFYAGVLSKVIGGDNRSPNLSNMVLFSQLFENKINLVKCYQEADPTDPGINDIVDTDGGYVLIPECSYIFALKQVKQSLFVFAINGVWEIRGDEGGFRATSYQVNKVSNIGVYAPKSIVEVNGIVYFWGVSGIYMITQNDFGTWDTNSLTIPTIQKLYNAIPDGSKKNARGFYDLAQNRARWMYYSSSTKEFGEAIDIDETPVVPIYRFEPGAVTNGSSNGGESLLIPVSADKYVIIYRQALAPLDLMAVVCTVDPITLIVTYNTPVTVSTVGVNSITHVHAVLLDTNKIIVTYLEGGSSGSSIANILTISGNTINVGASNNLGIAGTKSSPKLSKLTPTTVIHTYNKQSGSFFTFARVLSISGNTITAGAETTTPANTNNGVHLTRLSDTSALIVVSGGSVGATSSLVVLTVSGGIVTYNNPGLVLNNPVFQAGSAEEYYFESNPGTSLVPIITESIFESLGKAMLRILNVSGITVTSEDTSEYIVPNLSLVDTFSKIVPLTNNLAAFIMTEDNVSRQLYCGSITYSASSIVSKTSPTIIHTGVSNNPSLGRLSNSLIAWSCHTGTNALRTGVVRVGEA